MTICTDTGFFLALYEEGDTHHKTAIAHFKRYFENTRNQLVLPWPILYETIRTRFMRDRRKIDQFRRTWRRLELERRLNLLDDTKVRTEALAACLREADRQTSSYRALSLVDRVTRAFLADDDLRIDAFVTFNPGDFIDICTIHRRRMIAN